MVTEPRNVWAEYVAMLAERLRIESRGAALFDHDGLTGTARESFVASLLRDLLPDGIGVGSGEIFDQKGNRSRQIDVVLYDLAVPMPRIADLRLFPVEAVIAAIEVKSRLDAGKLREGLDNCLSVACLHAKAAVRLPPGSPTHVATTVDWDWIAPGTYFFAYENTWTSLETIGSVLKEWYMGSLVVPLAANRLRLPRVIATPEMYWLRKADNVALSSGDQRDVDLIGTFSVEAMQVLLMDLLSKVLGRTTTVRSDLRTRRDWVVAAALDFDPTRWIEGSEGAKFVGTFFRPELEAESREHEHLLRVRASGFTLEKDGEGAHWVRLDGLLIGRVFEAELAWRIEILTKVEQRFGKDGSRTQHSLSLHWTSFGLVDDKVRALSVLFQRLALLPYRLAEEGDRFRLAKWTTDAGDGLAVVLGEDKTIVGAYCRADPGGFSVFVRQDLESDVLLAWGNPTATEVEAIQGILDIAGGWIGEFLTCPPDIRPLEEGSVGGTEATGSVASPPP